MKINIRQNMRSIVRYIMIFAVLSATTLVRAQDQAVYNHYIANQGVLNPAYNGSRDVISGLLLFRSQWTGFKGAPYTGAFNMHGPITSIKSLRNAGVGVVLTEDKIGFTNQLEFFVAGSYKLKLDNRNTLSLGLQLGFKNIVYDGKKAVLVDYGDPVFDGRVSKFGFNFGFGAYLYTTKYFAGLSIPRFFVNKYNSDKQEIKNTVSMKDCHIYAYGGYVFDIDDIKFKPTALMRIVPGAPLTFDVSCEVMPVKNLWVGVSYRTVTDVVFLAEYQINKRLGVRYSFDYPINDIRKYTVAGSHEIGIQFDFQTKRAPGMRSIRYF